MSGIPVPPYSLISPPRARFAGVANPFQHEIYVLEHLPIIESQDSVSVLQEVSIPDLVLLFSIVVNGTVKLDDKPKGAATKVGNVTVDRVLADESEAELLST